MIKKASLISSLILLLTVNNSFASSDDYRIAIVDLNRIVNSTQEAKEKQKELEAQTKEAQEAVNQKAQKVKALEQEYMKTNNKEKGIELEKASRDLRLFAQDTKEIIQSKFKEINKRLIKDVMDEVQDYAEDNDIDLVLDKNLRSFSLSTTSVKVA